MRDNCIVVVMTKRRVFFDKDEGAADELCSAAYGDHITKTVF